MTPSLEFDAPELNLCVPQSNLVIRNGLPAGGTSGQHIVKKSDTDYDAEWVDPVIGKGDGTKSAMAQGAKDASGDYSFAVGRYTEACSNDQLVSGKFNVADRQTDTFTGNGTKTTFTLTKYIPLSAMTTRNMTVKVNGTASTDYLPYAMSGSHAKSMVIFNTAPEDGDIIVIEYIAQTYAEIVGNGRNDNNRSNARTLDWEGNEWLAGSLTLGSTTITEAQLIALLALL